MAPWPELENAQPNPSKYMEGTTSQQSTTPGKGKEPDKSKCCSSCPSLTSCEGPRRLRSDLYSSWPPLLVWVDDTGTPVTKIELLPSYSTVALIEEPTEVADPWDLPELRDTGIKWSGKSGEGGPPSVRVWAHGLHSIVSFVLSSFLPLF